MEYKTCLLQLEMELKPIRMLWAKVSACIMFMKRRHQRNSFSLWFIDDDDERSFHLTHNYDESSFMFSVWDGKVELPSERTSCKSSCFVLIYWSLDIFQSNNFDDSNRIMHWQVLMYPLGLLRITQTVSEYKYFDWKFLKFRLHYVVIYNFR